MSLQRPTRRACPRADPAAIWNTRAAQRGHALADRARRSLFLFFARLSVGVSGPRLTVDDVDGDRWCRCKSKRIGYGTAEWSGRRRRRLWRRRWVRRVRAVKALCESAPATPCATCVPSLELAGGAAGARLKAAMTPLESAQLLLPFASRTVAFPLCFFSSVKKNQPSAANLPSTETRAPKKHRLQIHFGCRRR